MRYREVIRMPLWLSLLIYFFLLSLVLSVWAALGNFAALLVLLACTGLQLLLYLKTALKIELVGEVLYIGRAHIELAYISECIALSNDELRKLRTRDADPAAYLDIRFWCNTGVKIVINDVRDRTPYWLISTSQAEKLAQQITKS